MVCKTKNVHYKKSPKVNLRIKAQWFAVPIPFLTILVFSSIQPFCEYLFFDPLYRFGLFMETFLFSLSCIHIMKQRLSQHFSSRISGYT